MARWDGLVAGRFLAVPEQGNLEEGQPRLLAYNISNCLHMKLHSKVFHPGSPVQSFQGRERL